MYRRLSVIWGIPLLLVLMAGASQAEEVSSAQIKGLDEQVQEIKGDVLAIAAELNQLEEKLLYPAHTQVAVFVSLNAEESMRLDSVDITLAGQPVAHHIYSFKELDALRKGGVQRIYTGNIRGGDHEMQVSLRAQSRGGSALEKTATYTLHKGVGPCMVEVTLGPQTIRFTDR